jgi:hypothetical protein
MVFTTNKGYQEEKTVKDSWNYGSWGIE